jgi:cytidylate kinase
MMDRPPVVAIDGPSGVGKGTLCRSLAKRLGWQVLDSGSLYRLTALAAARQNIPLADEERVAAVAANLNVEFVTRGADTLQVLLDGEEVTDTLCSETWGSAASKVAVLVSVRAALLERQRMFRRLPGLIADGRDMGTVVFPDAEVKIFLTASAKERGLRRYKQLKEKGINAILARLTEEIAERDNRDATREVAPLVPASDAEILDTTGLSIEEVEARALSIIDRRFSLG